METKIDTAQEIADFNSAVIGDVHINGKVGICKSHPALESLFWRIGIVTRNAAQQSKYIHGQKTNDRTARSHKNSDTQWVALVYFAD